MNTQVAALISMSINYGDYQKGKGYHPFMTTNSNRVKPLTHLCYPTPLKACKLY